MDQAKHVRAADIDNAIASEHFFTAEEASSGHAITVEAMQSLKLLTICVLVLHNGFTVIGTSACAHADTFDANIGIALAREDAKRKMWPLLGYMLRSRLHHAPAVDAAVTQLAISAENCETNVPIHLSEGNSEQAKVSQNNALSYRAAIALLLP